MKIQQNERRKGEEGMSQKELVEWYIDEHMKEIETEAQAVQLHKKLNCVLQRVINHSNKIVLLRFFYLIR